MPNAVMKRIKGVCAMPPFAFSVSGKRPKDRVEICKELKYNFNVGSIR